MAWVIGHQLAGLEGQYGGEGEGGRREMRGLGGGEGGR